MSYHYYNMLIYVYIHIYIYIYTLCLFIHLFLKRKLSIYDNKHHTSCTSRVANCTNLLHVQAPSSHSSEKVQPKCSAWRLSTWVLLKCGVGLRGLNRHPLLPNPLHRHCRRRRFCRVTALDYRCDRWSFAWNLRQGSVLWVLSPTANP